MSAQLEVPRLEDLSDVGVVIETSDQPWVVSLVAWANDGSTVTLTWDEIAGSASIRWLYGDEVRLVLERETPVKVSVRDERGVIEFHVWSCWEGMAGELIVRVGEHVSVHDTLLRHDIGPTRPLHPEHADLRRKSTRHRGRVEGAKSWRRRR